MATETKAAQHTPGPWEVTRDARCGNVPYIIAPESQTMIADVNATERHLLHKAEDAEADARLIAAAPELLEALNRMLVHFVGQEHVCVECGAEIGPGSGCDTCFVIDKAESAIRKAKGESL